MCSCSCSHPPRLAVSQYRTTTPRWEQIYGAWTMGRKWPRGTNGPPRGQVPRFTAKGAQRAYARGKSGGGGGHHRLVGDGLRGDARTPRWRPPRPLCAPSERGAVRAEGGCPCQGQDDGCRDRPASPPARDAALPVCLVILPCCRQSLLEDHFLSPAGCPPPPVLFFIRRCVAVLLPALPA